MPRCHNCGRENVGTQEIWVGSDSYDVCPICYVEIQKKKLEVDIRQTNGRLDNNLELLRDLVFRMGNAVNSQKNHLARIDKYIEGNANSHKDLIRLINEHIKDQFEWGNSINSAFDRMERRIKQLESKSSKEKQTKSVKNKSSKEKKG